MTGQKDTTSAAIDPNSLELAPGTEHENLEGWVPALSGEAQLMDALEKAFDYRGDVTITRQDGGVVEGYIFDRKRGPSLSESFVRLYPKDSAEKLSLPYSEIAGLVFSGSDRAAGKSWEAWMKKWQEKKAAGEKGIGLHPEKLD